MNFNLTESDYDRIENATLIAEGRPDRKGFLFRGYEDDDGYFVTLGSYGDYSIHAIEEIVDRESLSEYFVREDFV